MNIDCNTSTELANKATREKYTNTEIPKARMVI